MRAICRPTKMSASEVAAVRRARKGDKKALEEIIRLAEPFVFYNCLKFIGKDHEEDAQDLTQETLIKVCSRLNMLENNERYLSWALTITINTCKDFYRKKRDYELFSDTEDLSALEIYEEVPDEDLRSQTIPEKKVDNEETQKMIRDIVNELPDEQRIAVTLTYYDFLTSREIAQQLNVNENTVKYRLASARRKIRKRIEEYKAEGIKLYNVAPASFLSYLSYFLSNEAKEMAGAILTELPIASLMAALSEAGLTIGMITGSTTASIVSAVGAALSGVGVFLSAAGGKIVAIIVMTALVVGATESAASLNHLLFQSKPDRVEVEESTFSDENSSMNHMETKESSMSESEPSSATQTEMSSQQESSSTSESSSLESQVVYETSSTAQSSENTEEGSGLSTEGSGNASTGNSSEAGESSNNNNSESSDSSSEVSTGEASSNTESTGMDESSNQTESSETVDSQESSGLQGSTGGSNTTNPRPYSDIWTTYIWRGEIKRADGTSLIYPEETFTVHKQSYEDGGREIVNEAEYGPQSEQLGDPHQRLIDWAAENGYNLSTGYIKVTTEDDDLEWYFYNSNYEEITQFEHDWNNGDFIVLKGPETMTYTLYYDENEGRYSFQVSPQYSTYYKGSGTDVVLNVSAPENSIYLPELYFFDDSDDSAVPISENDYSYNGTDQFIVRSTFLDSLESGDYCLNFRFLTENVDTGFTITITVVNTS